MSSQVQKARLRSRSFLSWSWRRVAVWAPLGLAAASGACSSTDSASAVDSRSEAAHQQGAEFVVLNEVQPNAAGSDDEPSEFVELRGTPNGSLAGFYVLVISGRSGETGDVELQVNLGAACSGVCSIASDGLLLIGGAAFAGRSNLVQVSELDTAILNNRASSVLLIHSDEAISGADLDTDDNGVLELPTSAQIIDSISFTRASSAGDRHYALPAAQITTGAAFDAEAAGRIVGNVSTNDATAWFYGDVTSEGAYKPDATSSNTPAGMTTTPGAPNQVGGAGGEGGAGGATATGGATSSGGTAGTAGSAAGGAAGSVGGTAGAAGGGVGGTGGTSGTAGAAGSDGSAGSASGGQAGSGFAGEGGTSGSAGTAGEGGETSTGGATSSGGTGGTTSTGGSTSTGGTGGSGTGGRNGTGGSGTGGGTTVPVDDDDDGCSCRVPGGSPAPRSSVAWLAALGAAALIQRRRRR